MDTKVGTENASGSVLAKPSSGPSASAGGVSGPLDAFQVEPTKKKTRRKKRLKSRRVRPPISREVTVTMPKDDATTHLHLSDCDGEEWSGGEAEASLYGASQEVGASAKTILLENRPPWLARHEAWFEAYCHSLVAFPAFFLLRTVVFNEFGVFCFPFRMGYLESRTSWFDFEELTSAFVPFKKMKQYIFVNAQQSELLSDCDYKDAFAVVLATPVEKYVPSQRALKLLGPAPQAAPPPVVSSWTESRTKHLGSEFDKVRMERMHIANDREYETDAKVLQDLDRRELACHMEYERLDRTRMALHHSRRPRDVFVAGRTFSPRDGIVSTAGQFADHMFRCSVGRCRTTMQPFYKRNLSACAGCLVRFTCSSPTHLKMHHAHCRTEQRRLTPTQRLDELNRHWRAFVAEKATRKRQVSYAPVAKGLDITQLPAPLVD